MKKRFWLFSLISFILVSASTADWLLSFTVGDYSVGEGFTKAYGHFNFIGIIFEAFFRAIPYASVLFVGNQLKLFNTLPGVCGLWLALIVIPLANFYGYWNMQHSLYTAEHTSSTASLGLIFVPIHAIYVSAIAGLIGYTMCSTLLTLKK